MAPHTVQERRVLVMRRLPDRIRSRGAREVAEDRRCPGGGDDVRWLMSGGTYNSGKYRWAWTGRSRFRTLLRLFGAARSNLAARKRAWGAGGGGFGI
ncbi:hypothetical protein BaRGS_00014417 [Batillaria attramentaria]|uniref:Uncharacterized protein n=1 Tax=Batillaria attramentaria TaxID=370345 RepID=A0ABD0L4F6_9CAEN